MEGAVDMLTDTKIHHLIPCYQDSPEPAATTHEDSQSFEQTVSRFELQFSGMIYTLMERILEMGRDSYNDALVNVIYR